MEHDEKIFNLAKQLHLSGKISESQKIYLKLTKKYKNNDKLFFLLGTTFLQLKKYDSAIKYLNISINLNSKFSDTFNNIGIALAEIKKYSEAIKNYDKAIALKINYVDAYLNKTISLNKLKRFDEAIKIINLVIKLDPENAKAHNTLGNILRNKEKLKDSVAAYDKAIKINPEYWEAIKNMADVLAELKLHDKALIYYHKIIYKKLDSEDLLNNLLLSKMNINHWENLEEINNDVREKINKKEITIQPFLLNHLTDDPKLIKLNSENWISERSIKSTDRDSSDKTINNLKISKKNKDKIKIGYFSADFHDHSVLHVMIDIFKYHDRSMFDLYAFSHGIKKDDSLRKKVKHYFKKFYVINDLTDEEAIKLARNEKIDIAINLTGITKNHRTEIFLKRVAPIQVNYLGYPGTMGTDSIDYIIADKNIIPENEKKYYVEKVKYLPECYIPEPKKFFLKSTKNFSKQDFNLPQNKIIFCAINSPLKMNPKILNLWARILNKVKNSVLWIRASDEFSKKNLLSEFKRIGVEVNRVVFAEKVKEMSDHHKRLRLADIFLDSSPFSSHSTSYDYINAGLPMVTLAGNSFASKVASSIYSSINMNELVAKSETEYENIAISLANDKIKLEEIKNRIKKNIKNSNLFKSKEFTKQLEKVYLEIFNENILN
jgi:predicted O-linked N-acetylglucosamine transferase (SPINDLY family)